MALTVEILKADKALEGLSDDQLNAISTLSGNDEKTVISRTIGELHQKYDDDIKEITGMEKGSSVKSYDHLKTVLTGFKTKADSTADLQATIDTNKQTITDLEEKIKTGKGDDVLRQELKDAQDNLKALQDKSEIDSAAWATEKADLEKAGADTKINYSFSAATADLKFKPEYPDNVKDVLLKSAQSTVLGQYTPDWDENGTMIFRDDKGEIARNSENGLKPFTAVELLASQLKDSLDVGKQQPGTGTQAPGGQGSGGAAVDLSSASTQVEADNLIHKELMGRGITTDSPDYTAESMKMREEANVADLPLK